MSKYIDISTATTTSLAQPSDYATSSSTSKRVSNKIKIPKISITNYSTHADGATVKVFLDANRTTRTVNQTGSTTNKIIFDQENFVSGTDKVEVGDYVYDGSTGGLHGTITILNPDGDNTKEIQISASVAITDDETLHIQKLDHYITGTITIPAGITLVLDDPFFMDINNHILKITNTGSSPGLTVRID